MGIEKFMEIQCIINFQVNTIYTLTWTTYPTIHLKLLGTGLLSNNKVPLTHLLSFLSARISRKLYEKKVFCDKFPGTFYISLDLCHM